MERPSLFSLQVSLSVSIVRKDRKNETAVDRFNDSLATSQGYLIYDEIGGKILMKASVTENDYKIWYKSVVFWM